MKSKLLTRDTKLIMLSSFFYMASPMLVNPLITGFSESLGASGIVMGFVGGLANLCSLFCRPLVGNWTDRFSKFKLSFAGAVLLAAAGVGYMTAPNMAAVIAARILNGLGFACCSVCMSTWMSSLLPKDRIASGMGLYGTMNALSMAVAPVIGVQLRAAFGYRAAFCGAAVCSMAVLFVIPFVHDKGEPLGIVNENRGRFKIVDKKVVPIAVMAMLYGIPYFATQSFLVRYCEVRHFTVNFSLFFMIYAFFLLVLRLSLKNMFDRLPFGVFAAAGCILETIGLVCMTFLYRNWIMVIAAFCFAASYGVMCSVCQSTAIALAGPEGRGLANSTYYIGMDLGMSIGPILGGLLYGNIDIVWFYPIIGITMPLCALVCIAIAARSRQ